MKVNVLASGSKGNCCVVTSQHASVIIDCGCTISYLKEAFASINFDYTKADGLLITHCHTDHLKQIKMFKDLTVYSPFPIMGIYNERIINPNVIFTVGDLKILPVPLSHDTDITVGYIINDGKETLVQITDTGYLSDNIQRLIKGADYYIFESNHDPQMLMETNRPEMTKRRILSDYGHMCNEYATDVLCNSVTERTKKVVLAHISQEANTTQLAYQTFVDELDRRGIDYSNISITAAEQFKIYSFGN